MTDALRSTLGTATAERSSPHVRLVSWDDDPPLGGQGVYVRELREALVERGIRVSTVSGRGEHAVSYRRLTSRPHLDMSIAVNRRAHLITGGDPDLLHVSGGPGGVHLLRRVQVPVVYTAHHTFRQSHPLTSPLRLAGLLEARSYRGAAMVAAVSPSTARSVETMGVAASKVVVISPGVRLDEEGVAGTEREEGRVLFVGRLEREKGPLDAVAVMQRLAERLPHVRGYVAGAGSEADAVRRAAAAGAGRICFLGRVGDVEIARQYRRAQVVLVPSAFEGLGLVALEAMAAGAAVAGYDVEGLHDTLDGRGLLVDRGDTDSLCAAAASLITDRSMREELVARSVDHVRRERSWSRCAREFESLYSSVLGES